MFNTGSDVWTKPERTAVVSLLFSRTHRSSFSTKSSGYNSTTYMAGASLGFLQEMVTESLFTVALTSLSGLAEKEGSICQECSYPLLGIHPSTDVHLNKCLYDAYLQCKGTSWWQEATSPLSCEPTLSLHSDCRAGLNNSWNRHSH